MEILRSIGAVRERLRPHVDEGAATFTKLALVPTMGALHDGHLSLIRTARDLADCVIASVFVNPTQFGAGEDLERYPRDLDGDAEKLSAAGCDFLFAPSIEQMYPDGFDTTVQVGELARTLCGASRPGHFDGVGTVVVKLLNIIRPQVAVFGEKDFQQLAIIRKVVGDLDLDVEVVGAPIVRDEDGVALSSRNTMLSPAERARARALSAGLCDARDLYESGERSRSTLLQAVMLRLDRAGVTPEYLELRSFRGLMPVDEAKSAAVILVAARIGSTRLIDNLILRRP